MKKRAKALKLIQSIDWSELRVQKSMLFELSRVYRDEYPESATTVKEDLEKVEGIICLIDNLQDFAVDVLLIDEMHVFDFDEEEQRENETPEELFARENAEIIFQMHIEGTVLYEEEGLTEEFINSIIDNEPHITIIKSKIKKAILLDVKLMPINFNRDENNKLTYDSNMYDYGFVIADYCKKQWKKQEKQKRKIIGFQVVDTNNELHPDMEGSFCLYNAKQTINMLRNTDKEWKVLAIYNGDIEEPTYCFKGNPLAH